MGIWTQRNVRAREVLIEDLKERGALDQDFVPLDGHPWETDFLPSLEHIKKVTRCRLRDYSRLTLQLVKQHFVQHGSVDLEEECGALHHIVRAIDQDDLGSRILAVEPRTSIQSCLREIVRDAGLNLDFDAEHQRAEQSARGVLFDLAVEDVLGKADHAFVDACEAEMMFLQNRLWKSPYDLVTDKSLQFFLADGMSGKGGPFLRSLARKFDQVNQSDGQSHVSPVWRAMTKLWMNPDFPLWLMELPAILIVLNSILGQGHRITQQSIRELLKDRSGATKSHLCRASKLLITGVEIEGKTVRMNFKGYIERAPGFRALQQHLASLAV